MVRLFHELSAQCSRAATKQYSTSFMSAIRLLHPSLRPHICNIYGFVRFADEIVDSFHEHEKEKLLAEFQQETFKAIERRISLNPILNSFQLTVNEFRIPHNLIHAFFSSMEMDLTLASYNKKGFNDYIYGSAEAVGLMCLYVFCGADESMYQQLQPSARSLGAAFQKVNFLRDAKQDRELLGRTYFPGIDLQNFTQSEKNRVEEDIEKDFSAAFPGILQLPVKARFGVYVAYKYYLTLFRKIRKAAPANMLSQRIRIPNYGKLLIVAKAGFRNSFNIL